VDNAAVFQSGARPRPTEWTDTASGQISWSDCHQAAASPEVAPPCSKKSTMGHAGRDWGTDRNTKGPHDAGVALAIVIEVLIELLFSDRGRQPSPRRCFPCSPRYASSLVFCGLVLVTVGGALFAFRHVPGPETLLFLRRRGRESRGTAWGIYPGDRMAGSTNRQRDHAGRTPRASRVPNRSNTDVACDPADSPALSPHACRPSPGLASQPGRIRFSASCGTIPGAASGAHIHVGQFSPRRSAWP